MDSVVDDAVKGVKTLIGRVVAIIIGLILMYLSGIGIVVPGYTDDTIIINPEPTVIVEPEPNEGDDSGSSD